MSHFIKLSTKFLTSYRYISDLGIAQIDAPAIVAAGATGIRKVIPLQYLGLVLQAYNKALRQTFYLALAMSCASVVGAFAIEWRRIHRTEPAHEAENDSTEEAKEGNSSQT